MYLSALSRNENGEASYRKLKSDKNGTLGSGYTRQYLLAMDTLVCENCGIVDVDVKQCSGCKKVAYCGKICQKDDWRKRHKEICLKFKLQISILEKSVEKKQPSSVSEECANCGVQAALLAICSRCKITRYCCQACQRQDWIAVGGHKKFCIPTTERLPGALGDSKLIDGIKCMICQELLFVRSLSTLACSHIFHSDCLADLQQSEIAQKRCPVCRSALDIKSAEDSTKVTELSADWVAKARTAYDLKEYKRAANILVEVLALNPMNVYALFLKTQLIQHHQVGGSVDDANQCFKEILRIDPKNQAFISFYGSFLESQGLLELAEKHYEAAFNLNPREFNFNISYVDLLISMGKLEKGAQHYVVAIKLHPDQADLYFNYGLILQEQGKLLESTELFESVLKLSPNHFKAHVKLGILLQKFGRIEEAKTHFELAIKIEPNEAIAHSAYGMLLSDQGKYEKAAEHYRESLKIDPDDARTHYHYASLLREHLNNKLAALLHSRTAVELKDHVMMRLGYIQTLVSLGEFSQAEAEMLKLIESNPEIDCKSWLDNISAAKRDWPHSR